VEHQPFQFHSGRKPGAAGKGVGHMEGGRAMFSIAVPTAALR